ncbi:MAG: glucose-1-phosphate adenylyltransferase [Parcubacteria group bacterium CG10_big_fil_rev_8_21_14_0_10_38_31]|nr:MAG: glucose-1-phosphate adenylyltransferase [Parcubacteria group bacterium CG10_big_fil_rev_8_21_14_0_10_38_31]
MKRMIGVVMAGGRGGRLYSLTNQRAKPAVFFGGKYRIIDFIMNSFVNSGIGNIIVLTQYLSQSINDHMSHFWISNPLYGQYINTVNPQYKTEFNVRYEHTADSVYQNMDRINCGDFDTVAIFAGDHIVKIDVRQVKAYHESKEADFTVIAVPVPVSEASGAFGVIEVDEESRIIGFVEKPLKPKEIPGRPGWCFASMGNYLADVKYLQDILYLDAKNKASSHDFGHDIISLILKKGDKIYAYDFSLNKVSGQKLIYWRDVGSTRAFWEANMELKDPSPAFSLYGKDWPLRSVPDSTPPAKITLGGEFKDSLISGGCIISGGSVRDSVLSPNVFVDKNAEVSECVLFPNVVIGEGARLRMVIVDEGVTIPSGVSIGFDREEDERRGFTVKDEPEILVVPKHYVF